MNISPETAQLLLAVHGGSCSVPDDSPWAQAFTQLAQTGEVRTRPSSSEGFLDIYAKDFQPRFQTI